MPNQRADGKRLIGAQASPELWEGVDAWLEKNPRYNVTDFVLEALLEKLNSEGVAVDPVVALRDNRSRKTPKTTVYPEHKPNPSLMNDGANSTVAGAGARVLKKAAAANRRTAPK